MTMFQQFGGATAGGLSKASSLVFRIGTDAHLYDDPEDVSIAPLLDSKFDSEKVEALKRLLALIAQGSDVSNFFPQVVKNVASQSLEVKKLVYLYVLHYAEKRPDEALLSINCFQKDLSDPNPLVRAWALRTMAGIRLHAIAPIVLAAVSKCARDPSAYVRKCAANALPKLSDLRQEENMSTLEQLVGLLLCDPSPGVVGAAAASFSSVCPHNLLLIERNFRRLCETLPDVEEWGQIILIEILLRFVVAKHGLVEESVMCCMDDFKSKCEKDFAGAQNMESCSRELQNQLLRSYIEGSNDSLSCCGYPEKACDNVEFAVASSSQNVDIKLLLQCTTPLLWSQNSAVVLAAAGVHWTMSPRENVGRIVKPLLFLLRSSKASKYVVLCNIQVFATAIPSLFAPYYEDFFVYPSDSYQLRALKLEILSTIATDASISHIFQEIQGYVQDPDRKFAADAVAAIGLCAQRIPSEVDACVHGLLTLIKEESSISLCGPLHGEADILVQAILSVKAIVMRNPTKYEQVIVQLARNLDAIKEPLARTLAIWLIGEFSSIGTTMSRIIPVIMKYLAKCFTSEELATKHQILNTAAKVMLSAHEDLSLFRKILSYLLELAKFDSHYDIRDRARLMKKILMPTIINGCNTSQEDGEPDQFLNDEFSLQLLSQFYSRRGEPVPYPTNRCRAYLPGTLSQVVLHAAPGYEPLPKPCSLKHIPLDGEDMALKCNLSDRSIDSYSVGSDGSDTLSGSSPEQTNSDGNMQRSINSVGSDKSCSDDDQYGNGPMSPNKQCSPSTSPLIRLSDIHSKSSETQIGAEKDIFHSFDLTSDLADMMSKKSLESWLSEQHVPSTTVSTHRQGSVRISVEDLAVSATSAVRSLLQPMNGDGLKVDYMFSHEISRVSSAHVCIELSLENLSQEPLRNILVKDEEDSGRLVDQTFQTEESQLDVEFPKMLPLEEITLLHPGQKVKKILQVWFTHHLLPVKLTVLCNGQKYPVKLQPDIGYFLKPLSLDFNTFLEKEAELRGMFEYNRRCNFKHHINTADDKATRSAEDDKILLLSQSLASKVLSNANVHFVSADMPVSVGIDDVSGLCFRFSGEILSTSKPCLLSVTAQGSCSEPLDLIVKVNCEETVFGLNFLNRVVAFLS